jgi:hypothetical protein
MDGFIAPESLEDLTGLRWMALQKWIFLQRYIVLDRSRSGPSRSPEYTTTSRGASWPSYRASSTRSRFDADLNLLATNDNEVGHASGFAPPGDNHGVRNIADTTAISMHVYRARSLACRLQRGP